MGRISAFGVGDKEPDLVTLLARCLGEYRRAVRSGLHRAGYDDLPRSGSWVLAALAQNDRSIGELAEELNIAKQGISRLSDALVERGYARRLLDQADHRRVQLSLTPRGAGAAATVRAEVKRVNQSIEQRAGSGAANRAELALRALLAGSHGP